MKIIKGYPPNFQQIRDVFPQAKNPNTIFSYGDAVYVPSGSELPPELIAHEAVHCERQKVFSGGVEAWWNRYLIDDQFRYDEELLAHRAEYNHMIATAPSRQIRRGALKMIAKRLSSPLYGGMVTLKQAMRDINNG